MPTRGFDVYATTLNQFSKRDLVEFTFCETSKSFKIFRSYFYLFYKFYVNVETNLISAKAKNDIPQFYAMPYLYFQNGLKSCLSVC